MQNRKIWEKLIKEIATDEIVVITGARQVGKTTTLKWLLDQIDSPNKSYFDLENIIDREIFETKNYDTVLNALTSRGLDINSKLYIAIDEIQLLPNLPSVIKYLYDHYKIKFFLTGSSSFYIKNHFSQSMAGRKMIYEMYPLNFQEFIDFKSLRFELSTVFNENPKFSINLYNSLSNLYNEYIEYGGLPRVVLTDSLERKKELLEEIYSSYINLDVQSLADFKSIDDLRKVIKLLGARVGSRLNILELSNITGLSRNTIESYIQFLESTYLIRMVPVFTKSTDIETRLLKKCYFIDNGIVNINADLSEGGKFENMVAHQLSFYGDLFYYNFDNREIDFILNREIAIEVKTSPTDRDLTRLKRVAGNIGINKTYLIGKEKTVTFDDYLWGGSFA